MKPKNDQDKKGVTYSLRQRERKFFKRKSLLTLATPRTNLTYLYLFAISTKCLLRIFDSITPLSYKWTTTQIPSPAWLTSWVQAWAVISLTTPNLSKFKNFKMIKFKIVYSQKMITIYLLTFLPLILSYDLLSFWSLGPLLPHPFRRLKGHQGRL